MPILTLPQGYKPRMDIRRTEVAIKRLKDLFETELAAALSLTRVSAPLFVHCDSGLNDNLSGSERPVHFDILETGANAEIVHSLAKWKRQALRNYGFRAGEGLYTDMNAIRRDEVTDNLHSLYVDQWDWEVIIHPGERTLAKLRQTVERIYSAFLRTEAVISSEFGELSPVLPPQIHFITSQELEDRYPGLPSKAREDAIAKAHGAVFIAQIGDVLRGGQPHDGRAPDYDDWSLNGDILFDYPLLGHSMELSSMGIRVDSPSLLRQLDARGHRDWASRPFHQELLQGQLPQTMGGGIGQSRLCMFFLQKAHVGEVQASLWPGDVREQCRRAGVQLL